MNALVALMIVGGGILFAFALVSFLDKREKSRLLAQAEDAAAKLYRADGGEGRLEDPDEAWWGNGCLVLIYVELSTVVATIGKLTQVIPVRSILECSSMGSMDNAGTSRLVITMNDPMNPEIVLEFAGDAATQPQRVIAALISAQPGDEMPPPPVETEELAEEGEENEERVHDQVIDTTPRYKNIIMDDPRPNRDVGHTVIID